MKILLIKPPLNRNLLTTTRAEPLELEYLASAVKDHDVEIMDMRIEKNLMNKLGQFQPNFVGITAYTCDARSAKVVLQEVKKFDSRIKTAVGGHHSTFLPYDFAAPFVDVIFLGISDYSFKEYIDTLEEGGDVQNVKNIVLVKDNHLLFNERETFDVKLDSLPLPARELTLHYRKHYRDSMRNRIALVLTNRGCPFRCTFCACWKMMDGRYATRNPESVVHEMANLPEDVDLICFADDNTLYNINRARRLAELLKRRRIHKKFTMYARVETVVRHPDLIEELRDAGLEYLTVGIESCRDDELDGLNKKSSVSKNNEAIRILQKIGVSISAHFIVNPYYDEDDFRQLLHYVCEKNIFRPVFAVLTPLPGTDLYFKKYDQFVIRNYDYFDFAHSIFPTKLRREEFYCQLAHLYKMSYSFKRYFRSKIGDFRRSLGGFKEYSPCNVDRISFLKMALLHIFGYPLYLRLKHSYKSEPIGSSCKM